MTYVEIVEKLAGCLSKYPTPDDDDRLKARIALQFFKKEILPQYDDEIMSLNTQIAVLQTELKQTH